MNSRIKQRLSVLKKPFNEQYDTVLQTDNGIILKHKLVETGTAEYAVLLESGKLILHLFKRIEILPSLHESDTGFRKELMPGVKDNKNPDYKIGSEYWELEQPTFPYSYKKIDQRIRKGYQQADNLILYFEKQVNGFTVQKAINDRMQINRRLQQVIVIANGSVMAHIKRKPGK